MCSQPSDRSAQRGAALVFGLMALVLAAIGITIGVDQYKRAARLAAIQQTVADIQSIIGETRAAYGKFGFKGLTVPAALGAGIIPSRFVTTSDGTSARTATNQFGGALEIGRVAGSSVNSAYVSYSNIPPDLCASIVTQTEGQVWGVIVNGALIKFAAPPIGQGFALERLGDACSDPANRKQILWYFG